MGGQAVSEIAMIAVPRPAPIAAAKASVRVVDAHAQQHVARGISGGLAGQRQMQLGRFRHLLSNRQDRIEEITRVLHDECHLAAADRTHLALGFFKQGFGEEIHPFCRHRGALGQKAHRGAAGRGLSGPGFADDADTLAPDVEIDIGDGGDGVAAEANVKIADRKNGGAIRNGHDADPVGRAAYRQRC